MCDKDVAKQDSFAFPPLRNPKQNPHLLSRSDPGDTTILLHTYERETQAELTFAFISCFIQDGLGGDNFAISIKVQKKRQDKGWNKHSS